MRKDGPIREKRWGGHCSFIRVLSFCHPGRGGALLAQLVATSPDVTQSGQWPGTLSVTHTAGLGLGLRKKTWRWGRRGKLAPHTTHLLTEDGP